MAEFGRLAADAHLQDGGPTVEVGGGTKDQPRLIADSFVLPAEALDLVPEPLRRAAQGN